MSLNLPKIDSLSLPSQPLRYRFRLPSCPAIYFVLSNHNQVLYIGATKNLRNRWSNHHRLSHLVNIAKIARIAWLECSSTSELAETEEFLIKQFQPTYNGRLTDMTKPCSVTTGVLENESGYRIELGSPQWQEWVNNAQSFRYCPMSDNAPFTVRREGLYWYAYRKQQGKLHKRYLGKAEELTATKLEEIASLLNTPTEPRVINNEKVKDKPRYVTRQEFDQLHEELSALRSQLTAALGK